jgi:hypothetical protein
MPTFATPGPIVATVVVAGSRVRINASDRTDTVVLVEPIDKTSQSDVKVADKTKVDFAAGQLSVKTTASGKKNGSVAITIDLPAGSRLVSYLSHSDVHAGGSLGECELHMASGRVRLDRVDALQANVAAGEVAIGYIGGRATIDGRTVDMRIGEIEVGVSGGTAARVDANSKRGSVRNSVPSRDDPDVSASKVGIHARTRYGDIIIQRASR